MTTPTTTEHEYGFARAFWAVAIVGVLATLGGLGLGGSRWALGIAVGAAVAAANLWSIRLVVRGLLAEKRGAVPWGLLAVVKFAVLVGGLYLLVKSGSLDLLALLIGYGALPIGIASAQLGAARAIGEEG